MSLRPAPARWFELLTVREDAPTALEALAGTGCIELESRSEDSRLLNLRDLRVLLEQYQSLYRRYGRFWPRGDTGAGLHAGSPYRTLQRALALTDRWQQGAGALVGQLEALAGRQRDLNLFAEMLEAAAGDGVEYERLVGSGTVVTARLFVLPPECRVEAVPDQLLVNRYTTARYRYLLAVGRPDDLENFSRTLSADKGRILPIPGFVRGNAEQVLSQVLDEIDSLDTRIEELRRRVESVNRQYRLDEVVGDMQRLDWFLRHVDSLPVSQTFAWITGWTSDLDGRGLDRALAGAGVRALVHFPAPPADARAPMLLHNPRWARPFQSFVAMLGMPAAGEVDPSSLLTLLVPLLFGYMFGDVGQGLVLVVAGLWLRRRWPVLDVLVLNGLSAVMFGFLFGSLFGREDLIPALWLHPLEAPLQVLQVPLAGGVLVLVAGLLLRSLEYRWRGEGRRWWQVEAPQLVLYLSVLAALLTSWAWWPAAVAAVWYLVGALRLPRGVDAATLAGALGTLVESLVQLLINTLSFVRVGAFALAHAGLAMAFATLAAMPSHRWAGLTILLLGNLVIIALEGLVVTIQTTRLVLFEFFIRFLQAQGRVFHPLAAPAGPSGLGSRL